MKRLVLVLTITAMMLAVLVSGLALPALAQDEKEPRQPRCDWYYFEETRQWDAWWEYWCRYPDWGWEFVFWVWA